jgi:hypothetical protein
MLGKLSRPDEQVAREDVGWASNLQLLAWAVTISFFMSTEFVAQPFVWRNWSIAQVLNGWLLVFVERLLVACAIALCAVAVRCLRPRSRYARIAGFFAAVLFGALLGEGARSWFDALAGIGNGALFWADVLHWSLVGIAVAGILACWRLSLDYNMAAADAAAADLRARRMAVAAELDALRRQIDPHFLFNTLATIKRFGQSAPAEAYALLERLFDYISATLSAGQMRQSSLGAELELVRAYMDVCAVRMGPRLSFVDGVSEALHACEFPPLMLGTLVENALRHGLAPLASGGTIWLCAERRGATLEVRVTDDGAGLTHDGGSGLGLSNLSARLELLYGKGASFRLESAAPQGTRAILRIPYAHAA